MNVSLTPELEKFVSAKVESGRYNSASEVLREALRLLEEHDQARAAQLAAFNRELGRRLDALDRGEKVDATAGASACIVSPRPFGNGRERLCPQRRCRGGSERHLGVHRRCRSRSKTASRAETVSTYIVGFLPFLAEYFCRHVFRPMFTGLRRGFFGAPTFTKSGGRATVKGWSLSACLVPATPG
jgi:antitoxin ParD1/3/4